MSAEFKPGDRVRVLTSTSTTGSSLIPAGTVSFVVSCSGAAADEVCVQVPGRPLDGGNYYYPWDLELVAAFDAVMDSGYRGVIRDAEKELEQLNEQQRTAYQGQTFKYQIHDDEVRVVNEKTGGVKGAKAAKFSQLPWDVLEKLAVHYGKGGDKYGAYNWRKGYDWSLSIDALGRHLAAFMEGQDYDPETSSHHMLAVMFHAAALVYFTDEFPELDDRRHSVAHDPTD